MLFTKVQVPPARPRLVERARLAEALDGVWQARLLLVSAPAGYGKTTLLVEWAHQHRGRVAWLSLDATDDDPLRFWTYVVAAAFLRDLMGLQLRGEHVAALATSTEGWAADLQLAALALRARGGQADHTTFVNGFDGSQRFVLDHVAEEVLARQPKPLQAFLLHTSVLDRLCGPLCDAVTERHDGAATLAELERANLFLVPLDEARYWYRYHHLFADALRAHVRRTEPDLLPTLYQRAAVWCAAAELSDDAVGYALAGQAFNDAAGQIERVARAMIQRGETAMLQKWLDSRPPTCSRPGRASVWRCSGVR